MTLARKLLLVTATGILIAPQSRAQSKPEALAFEVASIKPSDPDSRGIMINLLPGGGLKTVNVRLKQLIEFAYNVQSFQVSGGPGWITTQGFDVLAKAPETTEVTDMRQLSEADRRRLADQVRQRLQALLAERFQLVIRRDSKEMPVYALVVAKNGPKLTESTDASQMNMRMGRGELTGQGITMELLANNLSRRVGRNVIDKTGLKGKYDFKLEFSEEGPGRGGPMDKADGAPGLAPAPAADPTGPSIFTALQEQLGLKLESTKGPVELLVVERVEKPTEN